MAREVIYWQAHRDEPIRGWMNVGSVAHYRVPRRRKGTGHDLGPNLSILRGHDSNSGSTTVSGGIPLDKGGTCHGPLGTPAGIAAVDPGTSFGLLAQAVFVTSCPLTGSNISFVAPCASAGRPSDRSAVPRPAANGLLPPISPLGAMSRLVALSSFCPLPPACWPLPRRPRHPNL